jgi:hypothetical protein
MDGKRDTPNQPAGERLRPKLELRWPRALELTRGRAIVVDAAVTDSNAPCIETFLSESAAGVRQTGGCAYDRVNSAILRALDSAVGNEQDVVFL